MLKRLVLPLLVTTTACGSLEHSLKHSSGTSGSEDATALPTSGSLTFTANYQQAPVDVIIVRDQSSHQDPFDSRITEAVPVLAALLWNLHNVHVGVFDDVFQPPQPNAPPPAPGTPPTPTTATPITDQKVSAGVLDPSTLSAIDFSNALAARLASAGNRGGDYLPASVLMAIQAESKKPNGGLVNGLLRPGAFVTVLLIGSTLDPADPYDASDVLTAYQTQGPSLMVSALTLDPTGCTVVDTTPPMVINQGADQVPQRNLEIKLQQATGGLFSSLCTNVTYSLFMTNLVSQGTGTAYFDVTLPGPVVPSTIKISSNGVNVPEYRYVGGSTTLGVSTLIPSGQTFTVSAEPAPSGAAAVTTGTAVNVDNVPAISTGSTTPGQ